MIKAERLLLRQWDDANLPPFAEIWRDREVLKKIGMAFDRHFIHPDLDVSSALREHVLYRIRAAQHLR